MTTLPPAARRAFGVVLMIAVCFMAADLTAAALDRRLQVPPRPLKAPPGRAADGSVAVAPPTGMLDILQATAPPGAIPGSEPAPGQPGQPEQPGQPPAVPSSNLKLKGTVAGTAMSLAMIEVQGKTEMVGVGEDVAGFTLLAVGPYSAQLRRGGETVTLQMDIAQIPASASVPGAPAPVAAAPVPEQQPDAEAEAVVPAPETEQPEAIPGEPISLSRNEFRANLTDPSIAGKMRMKPVKRDDEVVGMQMRFAVPDHPLARLGVQDNDIVTSVNGTKTTGPESLTEVYRIIRNSNNLRIMVERNGSQVPLLVNFTD